MTDKMRAAWFAEFGPAADVLNIGELDKPSAGPGQVLVRLHTSGVNPSDVKKRAGSFPDLLDNGPVIPNSDGAGMIEAVGDGVRGSRIGERVWIYQAQFGRSFGTAAEYVAIDSARAARLPAKADFDIGACLGIPVMTAHRCVFADGDVDGQTILITGGAGRVGYYAIQWASQAGARVIATASNQAILRPANPPVRIASLITAIRGSLNLSSTRLMGNPLIALSTSSSAPTSRLLLRSFESVER